MLVPVNTNEPLPIFTSEAFRPEIAPDNKPLPDWLIVSVRPFAKAKLKAPFTLLPVSVTSPVVASVVVRCALSASAPP